MSCGELVEAPSDLLAPGDDVFEDALLVRDVLLPATTKPWDRAACAQMLALLGDVPGDLTTDRPDLSVQVAHACLSCVAPDNAARGFVLEAQFLNAEGVGLELFGDQITPGDVDLLVVGIAGELENLHAVERKQNAEQNQTDADDELGRQVESRIS